MNILNIEHVSKVFGEKVVLDDVSYGQACPRAQAEESAYP